MPSCARAQARKMVYIIAVMFGWIGLGKWPVVVVPLAADCAAFAMRIRASFFSCTLYTIPFPVAICVAANANVDDDDGFY